jgi:hypothetical protein
MPVKYLIAFLCTGLSLGVFAQENLKKMPSLLPDTSGMSLVSKLADSIYDYIGLQAYQLDRQVFRTGYKGYIYLKELHLLKRTDVLTIIDYSKASHVKRLYVINLASGGLQHYTYVSHGVNSGSVYANSFSNVKNSYKSCLGFLLTAETYTGSAGYSLKLDGVEKDINHSARERAIVIHGSDYVTDERIAERGMPANSLGCPAIPWYDHKILIEHIKGGSCVFIYHPDSYYALSSPVLNQKLTQKGMMPAHLGNGNIQ